MRLREDGALVSEGTAFREVTRNSSEGVEQTWEFDSPPAGTGDVVVRVAVTGQDFIANSPSGLHFRDPSSGARTRYGHGTWIDRSGRKSAVPANFVDGRIVLRVPADTVDRSLYPAVLDPMISPEFGIDDPVQGPPAYYTWNPAIARAGNTYLVLWSDSRDGRNDVFGARVDATTGEILDPTGFAVIEIANDDPTRPRITADPVLVSDGSGFLVFWVEQRDGKSSQIYGRRVAVDGTVLDGPVLGGGVAISSPSTQKVEPGAVFFDGTNHFVTWTDGTTLDGARVAPDGAVLGGANPVIPLMSGVPLGYRASFATDGTNLIVVDGGRFVRVSLQGALLDATPRLFSWTPGTTQPLQVETTTVFDGTNFVVVTYQMRETRITPDGTVLDPPDDFNLLPGGRLLCADGGTPVALMKRGSETQLVWLYGADLRASRLDTSAATLLDGPTAGKCGLHLTTVPYGPSGTFAFTADANGFMVMTEDLGQRYDANLTALGPFQRVTALANAEDAAAIASNGQDFLVAWLDHRSPTGDSNVYAARIAGDGTVLDRAAIPLSTVVTDTNSVTVASNGDNYFVAWLTAGSGGAQVRGTWVSAAGVMLAGSPATDGVALDPAPTGLDYGEIVVGSDGVNYLAVWSENNSSTKWLQGVRFDPAGVPLASYGGGTHISIATASSLARTHVHVAANRTPDPSQRTYFVTWEEESSGKMPWLHVIKGARIRSALGRLVGESALSLSGQDVSLPVVASDGPDFLVLWRELVNKSSGTDYDVFGSRITALDGVVATPGGFPIGTSNDWADTPALTFDTRHYWAGWTSYPGDPPGDVRVTRLGIDAALLDGPARTGAFSIGPFDVKSSNKPHLDLAANAAGRVLAVYTTRDPRDDVRQFRVRARLVQDSASEIDSGIVYVTPPPDAGPDASRGTDAAAGGGPGAGGSGDASVASSGGGPGSGAGGAGGALISGTGGAGVQGSTGIGASGAMGSGGLAATGTGGTVASAQAGGSDPGAGVTPSGSHAKMGCGCRIGKEPNPISPHLVCAAWALACMRCIRRTRSLRGLRRANASRGRGLRGAGKP
jgi:hypothetical protein